jgi:hypothetical protein
MTRSTDTEHVCENCGRSFASGAELERHLRDVGLVD